VTGRRAGLLAAIVVAVAVAVALLRGFGLTSPALEPVITAE
jgi:hypothetical protein